MTLDHSSKYQWTKHSNFHFFFFFVLVFGFGLGCLGIWKGHFLDRLSNHVSYIVF